MKKNHYLYLLTLLLSVNLMWAQYSNKRLTTSTFDQNEPWVAIHPTDVNAQMAVWNDFPNNIPKPGYAFSTNYGATWSVATKELPSPYQLGADPSCAIDQTGKAFYCYLAEKLNPDRTDIFVSSTVDRGLYWADANISESITNLSTHDKPILAIDNTGGLRDGNIYVSWIAASAPEQAHSEVRFRASSNGGGNWYGQPILAEETDPGANAPVTLKTQPAGQPFNTAATHYFQAPMPTVGLNGDVYVVWADIQDNGDDPPIYNGSTFKVRRSIDGGANFLPEAPVQNFTYQRLLLGNSTIDISNVPSMAADVNTGKLYIVYKDAKSQTDLSFRIKFTASTDNGNTWSAPIIIGDIGAGWQFFPAITVEPNGRIHVSFMHSTDFIHTDVFFTSSTNGGLSFKIPVRITDQGSYASRSWTHHYMGLASASAQIFPIWTDFRNGNPDIYRTSVFINPGSPWRGNVYLMGMANYPGLSIDPGTVVQVDPGGISTNLTVNGPLNAVGTSDDHIKFMSARYPVALSGDWYTISLYGGPNTMKYCDISDGIYDVYVHNTNPTNLLESCTMNNASGYGLYSYLTLIQPNAVKVKDCAINGNVYGMTASNSRVDLVTTDPNDATKGVLNSAKYGDIQYNGGRVYLSGFRIANNGYVGNYPGVYINGTTAYTVFSPDSSAAGMNWVYGNTGGQIKILSGKAFLGDATRAGYNHVYGNCPWVSNQTSTTVMARRNYWGAASPPYQCPPPGSCFYGPVDYSNCLSSGMAPMTMPLAVREELDDNLNPTTASNSVSSILDAVDLVQKKMDQRDFDNVIFLGDTFLQTNLTDEMWLYFTTQNIHAAIGKGDLDQAEMMYQSFQKRGSRIDSEYASLIRETIRLERVIRLSSSETQSALVKPDGRQASLPPKSFYLAQNYPNPFNPTTRFDYGLPTDEHVTLRIFNTLGQEVAKVVDEFQPAGYKSVSIDAHHLPSGLYFYRLTAGNFTDIRKMLLLK